jgi:hypothetical protein
VVQSKYSFPGGEAPAEADWVVPVPAEPEVAALTPGRGFLFFNEFDHASAPDAVRLSGIIFWAIAITTIVGSGILIARTKKGILIALFLATMCLGFMGMITHLIIPTGGGGRKGVEVLEDVVAGAYRVRVVRAADAEELSKWLEEAGFSTSEKDRAALEGYVAKGWCFATAKLRKEEAGKAKLDPEGLAAPLVLAFPAKAPVYPLALTATAGGDTEIVLWIVAPHRVDGGPLPARFAAPAHPLKWGDFLEYDEETPALLREPCWRQPWLTKLKGRLTPEQMGEDLGRPYAPADEEMRETVVVW